MTTKKEINDLEIIASELMFCIKEGLDYFYALQELEEVIKCYSKRVYVANDFFTMARKALNYSSICSLIKVYDRHKDSVSVFKLINKCLSTDIFKDDKTTILVGFNDPICIITEFQQYLERKKELLDSLYTRRDKFYMHNDQVYFSKVCDLKKVTQLSFDDAFELFNEAQSFCNSIFEFLNGVSWNPSEHLKHGIEVDHKRSFCGLKKLLGYLD